MSHAKYTTCPCDGQDPTRGVTTPAPSPLPYCHFREMLRRGRRLLAYVERRKTDPQPARIKEIVVDELLRISDVSPPLATGLEYLVLFAWPEMKEV